MEMDEVSDKSLLTSIRLAWEETPRYKIASALIMLSIIFERAAYFSFAGNLVSSLVNELLCWTPNAASTALLVSASIAYSFGLLTGWISDAFLGRFKVITAGFVVYILGYIYFIFIAGEIQQTTYQQAPGDGCDTNVSSLNAFICTSNAAYCDVTIYIAVTLISLGAGTVRTNLIPFGADVVRDKGIEGITLFLNMFYWCINIGCVIAYAAIANIQQLAGFFLGFCIAGGCLVISAVFFLSGTKLYPQVAGKTNVFSIIIRMYKNASKVKSEMAAKNRRQPSVKLDRIDFSKVEHGGKFDPEQVENIKKLWCMLRVFLLFIPYWICHSQTNENLYLLQGLHLRLSFANTTEFPLCSGPNTEPVCYAQSNYTLPDKIVPVRPITLMVFNSVSVLVFLPVVFLLFKKKPGFFKTETSKWFKMVVGMSLAVVSLFIAGTLEHFRLSNIDDCGYHNQMLGYNVYWSSPGVSIWYQIPQYMLIGASEVLMIVTGLEYTYIMAPRAMQGVSIGLFYLVEGIAHLLSIALPYIYGKIPGLWRDSIYLNCDHLDYIFFALGSLLSLYVIGFSICVKFRKRDLCKLLCPLS